MKCERNCGCGGRAVCRSLMVRAEESGHAKVHIDGGGGMGQRAARNGVRAGVGIGVHRFEGDAAGKLYRGTFAMCSDRNERASAGVRLSSRR